MAFAAALSFVDAFDPLPLAKTNVQGQYLREDLSVSALSGLFPSLDPGQTLGLPSLSSEMPSMPPTESGAFFQLLGQTDPAAPVADEAVLFGVEDHGSLLGDLADGLSATTSTDDEAMLSPATTSSTSEETDSPTRSVTVAKLRPMDRTMTRRKTQSRTQAKSGKKTLNYNPNRARDEQRRELRTLRAETAELETQLEALQVARRWRTSEKKRGVRVGVKHLRTELAMNSLAESAWKALAQRQFDLRMRSTGENERLKSRVHMCGKTISRLQRLLLSHPSNEVRLLWRCLFR